VKLDPGTRRLTGSGRIVYQNPSPNTLREVWLHLYLNAFRSTDTLWMREAGSQHRDNGFDPRHPGWILLDHLSLAESGEQLQVLSADPDETIARVPLPRPLGPGERLDLQIRWTAQLPRVFARTGFYADPMAGSERAFFMVGQWYPKLAVYDRGQWDTEPWHANAEFFADFGDYDLAVTVPAAYLTGASGVRVGETPHSDGTKTVQYRAERVTDVAWTAWPSFLQLEREITAADRRVQVELLLPPPERESASRYLDSAALALDRFGRWYGTYPWPKLTIVVPPAGAEGAGGMEYPTLVTADLSPSLPLGLGERIRLAEIVTVHEIAHQWFPLQVQTNEAIEPWLDEGFADYLTIRLLERQYGVCCSALELPFVRLGYGQAWRGLFLSADPRQPLAQPAWALNPRDYGTTMYAKGSLSLLSLERILGDDRFTAALRTYADRWRWRHPTTPDLEAALKDSLGEPLDWFFGSLVSGRDVVEYELVDLTPDQATVVRRGEAPFPVEVQLTYADGGQQVERWDGGGERLELASAGQVLAAVAIDPAGRLVVQVDRLDDARHLEPRADSALAAANRWLGLVQALLQLIGQVG
jgi:hypothetical protein